MTTGADVDRLYIERWAQQLGLGEIWEAVEKRLRLDITSFLAQLGKSSFPSCATGRNSIVSRSRLKVYYDVEKETHHGKVDHDTH